MKIGVLIYTYNRTDDARINMEIIRKVWSKNDFLKDVAIVHTFNGKKEWWPDKYLEDELIYLDNPGHFNGAEILINAGAQCFADKYPDVDYVIILASDTWLTKPEYVESLIKTMQTDDKYLATCPWGTKEKDNMWNIGMALDFCIIKIKWSVKSGLFPLRFKEFADKYSELFLYKDDVIYLERVFAMRFKQAIENSSNTVSDNLVKKIAKAYVYRMKEREPVHDARGLFGIKKGRKMAWPEIGLYGQHNPRSKQEVIRRHNLNTIGEHSKKLAESIDLSYYNRGLERNTFTSGKVKVSYGE